MKATLRDARGIMYLGARLIGDVIAIWNGPKATAKRFARKEVYKQVGKRLPR